MERPKVVYQDSTKQAVADDWRRFVREQLAPLPVICPSCNGVVQVENDRHLFAMKRVRETEGIDIDALAVHQIVEVVVDLIVSDKVWREALNEYERSRGRYLVGHTSYVPASLQDDEKRTPAELLTKQVVSRMRLNSPGGDLYTYCVTCEEYIPVDLPGFMRSDVKEEFVRRVLKEHLLDYRWRAPEAVLPKREPKPLPKPEAAHANNPPMQLVPLPVLMVGAALFLILLLPLLLRVFGRF